MNSLLTDGLPAAPLPWWMRPWQCMLGLHHRAGLLGLPTARYPFAGWRSRCARCGKRMP